MSALVDLIGRLERAESTLLEMSESALKRYDIEEWHRLSGKREGVALALSYTREAEAE